MNNFLNSLPVKQEVETKNILKKSIQANRALAELKAKVNIIPNKEILINTLTLQEAQDSSAIENIVTTHDEIYQTSVDFKNSTNAAKEVRGYQFALLKGFK